MRGIAMASPFSLEPQMHRRLVEDRIVEIAKEVQGHGATFLFGAGMSIPPPSGMPSGSELGKRFVREFLKARNASEEEIGEISSKFPLDILAEAFEKDNPRKRQGLHDCINSALENPASRPHAGHEALVALGHFLPRIYTTNFDTLIEKQFSKDGCVSIVAPEDIGKIEDNKRRGVPAIIHLHGMVGANFVVTESDLLQPDFPLQTTFEQDLYANVFVFVGYSLSDPNLRSLYFKVRRYLEQRPMMNKHTFAVSRVQSEDELVVAEKAWVARGITLIPEDAATFMVRLANEVSQAASAAKRRAVAERMLGKDGDVAILDEEVKGITDCLSETRKEDILDCFEELTRIK
jgi:hypothetical protein